jgi:MFS family permease
MNIRDNIPKLYLLNFLSGIVFWYPIEKLFLQHIGVNAFGVSIDAVVFLTIQIVFDIPSGVLADKWTRKYTLLLAMCALAAGSIIGGLSHSLPVYVLATVLVGGFVVLTSGTFQALMYDSLRTFGSQAAYDKHQGRAYALFLAGLGLSSLAGGYLAQWSGYRATYFMTAVVMGLAALLACLLVEPQSHKAIIDTRLKTHIYRSIKQIVANQLLFNLALLISAANILRGAQNEYAGLFFIALGLTAIPIGYANAAKWLASSVGQIIAPRLGRKILRFAPLFFFLFASFGLIHNHWSLVLFFAAGLLYSIISNQAEAAIQDNTPSEIRATTLSVVNFASNILLIPLGLLFGWITLHSNVFAAYLMIAAIGLIYLVQWLIRGRKIISQTYTSASHSSGPQVYEENLA